MYSKLDLGYLCLVVGDCWYCVDVVCISNYEVDVVAVGIVCVGDSMIGLCVYSCSEMEADRNVDELFDVDMFDDGSDVEVVAG